MIKLNTFGGWQTLVDGEPWYRVSGNKEVRQFITSNDPALFYDHKVGQAGIYVFDVHESVYLMLLLRYSTVQIA